MSVFQTDVEQKAWMNQIKMAVYQMTEEELDDFLFIVEIAKSRRNKDNLQEIIRGTAHPFVQVDLGANEWTIFEEEKEVVSEESIEDGEKPIVSD